jgi:hypothetical protein
MSTISPVVVVEKRLNMPVGRAKQRIKASAPKETGWDRWIMFDSFGRCGNQVDHDLRKDSVAWCVGTTNSGGETLI